MLRRWIWLGAGQVWTGLMLFSAAKARCRAGICRPLQWGCSMLSREGDHKPGI